MENLPASFIAQLATLDPVVRLLCRRFEDIAGGRGEPINARLFVTSKARLDLAVAMTMGRPSDREGVRAVGAAIARRGDPEFSEYNSEVHFQRATRWACGRDVPGILEDCLTSPVTEVGLFLSAANAGSTRVLDWFLSNSPVAVDLAIARISGFNEATVRWCLKNRSAFKVSPVWSGMKADAAVHGNRAAWTLLDWVEVYPCSWSHEGGCYADERPEICHACPACRIAAAEVIRTIWR
jgi:hypothetical protein